MKNLSQFSNLVDSYKIGESETASFFADSEIENVEVKINNTGTERAQDEEGVEYNVTSYEAYADSGSEDYFYFQVAEIA